MEMLTEEQLAHRWQVSIRTLQNWRWQGRGPRFLKIGRSIRYPLDEVDTFERERLHANTSAPVPVIDPSVQPRH